MSEKPTYNQINEQQSSAYVNRSNAKPTVLIERTDHRITVGKLDLSTRDVHFTEDGVDKWHPEVSLDRLSDQHQAELAEQLAEKPLRDKEVGHTALTVTVELAGGKEQTAEEVSAQIDSLLDGLTDDDKRRLHAYSRHMNDKRLAQKTGDGEFSVLSGNYAGQELRAMSPAAQEIATSGKYDSLMDRLSYIRRNKH